MKLDELANRYLDGTATAQEMVELNELLQSQPSARRTFAEYTNLDSALAEQSAGWEHPKIAVKPLRRRLPQVWLAAAACLAFALLIFAWQQTHQITATVTQGVGLNDLSQGMTVRNESHQLTVGTVEFLTARGARVVIEAPASFRFESAQRLHMLQGRVAADVPPSAKGFTVITPTGKAVDLGTKFGVDVPAVGEAEIHVFQGEVIAQSSNGGKRHSLRDGEAYSLQSGAGESREIRSAAFIRPDEMASLSAGFAAGQRARSEALLKKLRADPALIALLDFETPEPLPGNYRMVQGRWPGSQAPEFVHVGDHMKLDIGGEHPWQQLTLAAWVRLDRLGAPYQSLYHTDGWDEEKPGQVHWIINRDSTMRLALKLNTLAPGSTEKQGFPDSLTPVLPEQGRWVHLAVVYDAKAKTARFYFNGKFDKVTHQEISHPALLGPAQIGNWNTHDRTLSGRIDEFLMLGRTMTDEEIHDLHAAGNPYL